VSFSDGRIDDALRDLLGWPTSAAPTSAAEKVEDLRQFFADLRRRRASRAPVWTKDWRP
jgi:hypothetical protein